MATLSSSSEDDLLDVQRRTSMSKPAPVDEDQAALEEATCEAVVSCNASEEQRLLLSQQKAAEEEDEDDAELLRALHLAPDDAWPSQERELPAFLRARRATSLVERLSWQTASQVERGDADDRADALRLLPVVNDALPARSGRVMCFDVETTGLGRNDSIIELGAVELIDGVPSGVQFCARAHATWIHPSAELVHGISVAALANVPPLSRLLAAFVALLGTETPLVAHNAAFDRRFLARACAARGVALPQAVHCTMRVFGRRHPLQSKSLDNALAHLGVALDAPRAVLHNALDDAKLVAKLLQAQWAEQERSVE
eukprot:TRINITY_DN4238_c0_g1_i1.p1 TRINITY_DN4238_c0_g1~~TRINITY_DN4238_c0_g1_i1.p1  ORF type:complete len:314 (+),score=167.01 TRINITY_DN4238_c0_g1_i1:137-1078(+)